MNLIAKRLVITASQEEAYQKLKDVCEKIQKGIDDIKSHAENDITNANQWIDSLKNMQTKNLSDDDVQKYKDTASTLANDFNDCFRYLLEDSNVTNPEAFITMIEQDSNNEDIGKTIKLFQDDANKADIKNNINNVQNFIKNDVKNMINENMSLDELKKTTSEIHNIAHFLATLDKQYNNLDDETQALMNDSSFNK